MNFIVFYQDSYMDDCESMDIRAKDMQHCLSVFSKKLDKLYPKGTDLEFIEIVQIVSKKILSKDEINAWYNAT